MKEIDKIVKIVTEFKLFKEKNPNKELTVQLKMQNYIRENQNICSIRVPKKHKINIGVNGNPMVQF